MYTGSKKLRLEPKQTRGNSPYVGGEYFYFTSDTDTGITPGNADELVVVCGGAAGIFSISDLTLPGTVTATDVIGGSRMDFTRGHRTTSITFTSTERVLGENGSAAFSSAISYANATLTSTNILYADSPFIFNRAPSSLKVNVIALFGSDPTDFTVTIRKASDGALVEAKTSTTAGGGTWSLTFDHTLFSANTWYYVTWAQTTSTNSAMSLQFNVLL